MLKMLRAMDPLAHYLFITVMTVVPQFLQGVVDGGLMKGYKVEVEEARGLRFHTTFCQFPLCVLRHCLA